MADLELEIRSDSRGAMRDLQRINQQTERIVQSTGSINRQFANITRGIQAAAVAFGAFASVRSITNVTDSYRRLEARIALTNTGLAEQQRAFTAINRIALDTRSNQEGLADLYSRIGRATRDLGIEQETVIDVTRNIARAITVSGSSAESANAAIVQLGQGLAAGALRGQELNSVMEQTPAVAQALARGLNLNLGELRAFAEQGLLTAEVVVEALRGQGDVIAEEFSRIPPTYAQALQNFSTGLSRVINEVDQVTGISGGITDTLLSVGETLNRIAPTIGTRLRESLLNGSEAFQQFSAVLSAAGRLATAVGNTLFIVFLRLVPTSVVLSLQTLGANLRIVTNAVLQTALPFRRLEVTLLRASRRIEQFNVRIRPGPITRFARTTLFALNSAFLEVTVGIGFAFNSITRFVALLSLGTGNAINAFTGGLSRLTGFLSTLARELGATGFADALRSISIQLGNVGDDAARFVTRLSITFPVFAAVVGTALNRAIAAVSQFGAALIDGILTAGRSLNTTFIQRFVDDVRSLFADLYIELVGASIWPDTIDAIVDYSRNIFNALPNFEEFANRVSRIFGSIGNVVSNFNFRGITTGLGTAFEAASDSIGLSFQEAFVAAALFVASYISFGFTKVFIGLAGTFGISLVTVLNDTLSSLGTSLNSLGREFGRQLNNSIRNAIAALPEALLSLLSFFGPIANELSRSLIRGVGIFLSNLIDRIPIIGPILSNTFGTALEVISNSIAGVFNVIDTLTGNLLSTAIFGGAIYAVLFGANPITALYSAVTGLFSFVGRRITLIQNTAAIADITNGGIVSAALFGNRRSIPSLMLAITTIFATVRTGIVAVSGAAVAGFTSIQALATATIARFRAISFGGLLEQLIVGGSGGGIRGAIRFAILQFRAFGTAVSTELRAIQARVATTGGILSRVLTGRNVGIAVAIGSLLAATSAFASDTADILDPQGSAFSSILSGAFDAGILAVSIFGIAGIGPTVSLLIGSITRVIGAILTGFTAILANPVGLAIFGGAAVVGLLTVAIFGVGNTLEQRFRTTITNLAQTFGILDRITNLSDRGSVLEEILNGIDAPSISSADLGGFSIPDLQANLGSARVDLLSSSEFSRLTSATFEVVEANNEANALAARGNATAREILTANRRAAMFAQRANDVLEENNARLSRLGSAFVSGDASTADVLASNTTFLNEIGLGFASIADFIRINIFDNITAGVTFIADSINEFAFGTNYSEVINGFINSVGNAVENSFDAIANYLSGVADGIPGFEDFNPFSFTVFTTISDSISAAVDSIGAFFSQLDDDINNSAFATAFRETGIVGILGTLNISLQSALSDVIAYFQSIIDSIASFDVSSLNPIDAIVDVVDSIGDALTSVFTDVRDYLLEIPSRIRAASSEAFSSIGNFFGIGNGNGTPVQRRAQGGAISGPGTGTSDSIPVLVSNGEYVINAAATSRYLPLLEAINSGSLNGFRNGGLIGRYQEGGAVRDSRGNIIVNIDAQALARALEVPGGSRGATIREQRSSQLAQGLFTDEGIATIASLRMQLSDILANFGVELSARTTNRIGELAEDTRNFPRLLQEQDLGFDIAQQATASLQAEFANALQTAIDTVRARRFIEQISAGLQLVGVNLSRAVIGTFSTETRQSILSLVDAVTEAQEELDSVDTVEGIRAASIALIDAQNNLIDSTGSSLERLNRALTNSGISAVDQQTFLNLDNEEFSRTLAIATEIRNVNQEIVRLNGTNLLLERMLREDQEDRLAALMALISANTTSQQPTEDPFRSLDSNQIARSSVEDLTAIADITRNISRLEERRANAGRSNIALYQMLTVQLEEQQAEVEAILAGTRGIRGTISSLGDIGISTGITAFSMQTLQAQLYFMDLAQQAFDLTTILNSPLSTDQQLIDAAAAMEVLTDRTDAFNTALSDSEMFVNGIGQSLTTGITDFLTGADGLGGLIEGVLDSASSSIINSFVSGIVSPIQDSLTSSITDSLTEGFTSGIGSGGSLLSGLFGDLFSGGGGGFGGFFSSLFGGGIGSFFGFNQGGLVPQTPGSIRGTDSVPALLTPGEYVVPADMVDNLNSSGSVTVNLNVTGNIDDATDRRIMEMLPRITDSVQNTFTERRLIT